MMDPLVALSLRGAIEPKLTAIRKLFLNPKLTLIVRSPDLGDGDLILTEDDLDEVVKAIRKLARRQKKNERTS